MTGKIDQRTRLTLRQLEVFMATARAGSTRAAADQVARSQSAASAALAELEQVLGVALFDRVGRRLVLNENGQALLPVATSQVEQALEIEQLFSCEHAAPLAIAASFTVGEYVLPPLIAQWRLAHAGGSVSLAIANTREVLAAVAAFEVSVGFIEGSGSHPDLIVKRWQRDELVVVAARSHALAEGATLRQLAQATWILRERGSGTREASDGWLSAHLSEHGVGLELGSNEAVKRAVGAGLGLACLSRHAVHDALREGWLAEVRTPMPAMQRSLGIARHRMRHLGAVADGFVRFCMAQATKP